MPIEKSKGQRRTGFRHASDYRRLQIPRPDRIEHRETADRLGVCCHGRCMSKPESIPA